MARRADAPPVGADDHEDLQAFLERRGEEEHREQGSGDADARRFEAEVGPGEHEALDGDRYDTGDGSEPGENRRERARRALFPLDAPEDEKRENEGQRGKDENGHELRRHEHAPRPIKSAAPSPP